MKVTRIIYSKQLNKGKFERLEEIAKRLGSLRKEVWHRFGSISGLNLRDRQIRDKWVKDKYILSIPARLWKETLRDSFSDIITYREACKVLVRKSIYKRVNTYEERKRLYTLLKYNNYLQDNFLSRKMRKIYKHGKTSVDNQIVLESSFYTTFTLNGKLWIKVMSLVKGKRICIPLNSTHKPSGTLRLILRQGRVEVHYVVDAELVCNCKPCGTQTLGVDKGYTEVFTDSDGQVHGDGLGKMLSKESNELKVKYQKRNKISALEKNHRKRGNHTKANRIKKNNLGRKKLDKRRTKHNSNIRDKIYKATHSVVDKAKVVVAEDLSKQFKGRSFGKNQNRRLNSWTKGIIEEALIAVTKRRGSTLVHVNAAYASQMDSRSGLLQGRRSGEKFHCFDGVVLQADVNAARNILARMDDTEVGRYTPYQKVKSILLERTKKKQTVGTAQPRL